MAAMTVIEAVRSTLDEALAGDDRVFLMGEEVGYYQGAYKVTEGLLERFGARLVVDTAITEEGFAGVGVGAAGGAAPSQAATETRSGARSGVSETRCRASEAQRIAGMLTATPGTCARA